MAYYDSIKDLSQYSDIYQRKVRLLQQWGRSSLKRRGCLFSMLLLLILIPAACKLNCCLPQNLIASLVISWLYPVFSLNDEIFRYHPAIVWVIIFFTRGVGDIHTQLIFCKGIPSFIAPRRWLRRGYRRLHQATEPIHSPVRLTEK